MRILGWLATVVGVIGVAICLVVAVGVWVVKPQVTDRAHEIVTIAHDAVQKADALAVTASGHLVTVSDKLTTIEGLLTSVAASPLVDTAVGTSIRNAISGFVGGPYANLKENVSGLVERVQGLSTVVQKLDAAIPGLELPGVATDAVDDIVAKLTTLDQTVTTVNDVAGNGVTTSQQITQLSTLTSDINAVIQDVVPRLETARTKLADVEARLNGTDDRIERIAGISAIGVSILFIYLALLNVLLYQQGRRWVARARES
jgi:hypothetical protein